MQLFIASARRDMLIANSSSSPHAVERRDQHDNGSVATCTTVVMQPAPLDIECTGYGKTVTSTRSVNCHGCELSTRKLGAGLVRDPSCYRIAATTDVPYSGMPEFH